MFTIKNAIMEVLSKTKTIDEVLFTLDNDNKVTFLAAFNLMKNKLEGHIDILNMDTNGQWGLQKNTLDYSKLTPVPRPRAGAGAIARRDAARQTNQNWANISSPNQPKYIDKSEDSVKEIKAKYIAPKELTDEEKIADIKLKSRKKDAEAIVKPEKIQIAVANKDAKTKKPS